MNFGMSLPYRSLAQSGFLLVGTRQTVIHENLEKKTLG
jgi:anti-sigma factor RsiW